MSLRKTLATATALVAMCVVAPSAGAEVIDLRKNPDPQSAIELGVTESVDSGNGGDESVDPEGRAEEVATASVDAISDFLHNDSSAKPSSIARLGVLTTIADVEDYTHQAGDSIYEFIESLKSTPEYARAMVEAPTSIEDTEGLTKMVQSIKRDAGDLDVSAVEEALKGKSSRKSNDSSSRETQESETETSSTFIPRSGEPSPLPSEGESESAEPTTEEEE